MGIRNQLAVMQSTAEHHRRSTSRCPVAKLKQHNRCGYGPDVFGLFRGRSYYNSFLATCLLFLFAPFEAACCRQPIPCAPRSQSRYQMATRDGIPTIAPSTETIAAVGDLQGLLLIEHFFRENNSEATGELVCQLGRENIDVTVLLGDLVTWGASDSDWERFDELMMRVGGTLLPVKGNHDLMGDAIEARNAWLSHFPWFGRHPWYAIRWNRLGLLFLDSNLDHLEPAAQVAEEIWYNRMLEYFDRDPSIHGVMVFLHHAPFTVNPNALGGLDSLRGCPSARAHGDRLVVS